MKPLVKLAHQVNFRYCSLCDIDASKREEREKKRNLPGVSFKSIAL